MELNYKATNIAKAERECGLKFFTVIGSLGSKEPEESVEGETVETGETDEVDMSQINFGIGELVFLCKAGGASDEEINETFKTGLENVLVAIMEGLSTAGFFGELKIDTTELKNTMKKSLSVSQNTGKADKN